MAQVKVLIVAVAPVIQELRQTLLGRSNFQILTTSSAIEGYNLAKYEHPDLAIVDIALTDVAGDELCRDIKGDPQTKSTIVAMLIDGGDEWFAGRARDAGADHLINKPLIPAEFEKMISGVIKAPARHAVRIPIRIKVDGSSSQGEMRGETIDVSISGIQLQMKDCDLEKGFHVWLKFQPMPDLPAVVCRGEVVRVMQQAGLYRVGIQIKAYNADGANVLRKALRLQAE
jgi:DNA-binding response OmpR family regulator